MAQKILICDDSAMARKHLQRNLPTDWEVQIYFAANGLEALSQIEMNAIELLFLDLNMPELDGYGVLLRLQRQQRPPKVIVCSADIQPEALRRAMALGALAFLKKPATAEQIAQLLQQQQLYQPSPETQPTPQPRKAIKVDYDDALREICNVAMGRAGASIAQVLGTFVELPIPHVRRLTRGEMMMLIAPSVGDKELQVISQGFIGAGISGEALLMMRDGSYASMGQLMGIADCDCPNAQIEIQMDTANILFASFLTGLSEQLNIAFGQSHPVVLNSLSKERYDEQTLAVEISYRFEAHEIVCDLLLLFPQASLPRLENTLQFLVD
ncbi:response regulator [Ferrimonas senticii]|uniref:response regulator n=1 Tax=Ferrimonas senticii TaxID=394566 RepID=UPI00040AE656|nr:response regulator [Ferrimonas senticii]